MQNIVVKFVLLIPQPNAVATDIGHCLGDVEKMLEKFGGDILVDVVLERQFERNAHQVQCVHRHPGGAVGLVDVAASRQRRAAVENADIVETEKSALKDIASLDILAVDPPSEIEHQLVKDALEEWSVCVAAVMLAVDLVDAPCRPSVHWRVD